MTLFSLDENHFSQENHDQGIIILFHENFAAINQVPHNFFLGNSFSDNLFHKIYGSFFGEQKSDLLYDDEDRIAYTTQVKSSFSWLYNKKIFNFLQFKIIKTFFKVFFLRTNIPRTESLFIGGFVPMTKCEYNVELEITSEKGFVIIQTPNAKIFLEKKNTKEYFIESFFQNTSKTLESKKMLVPNTERKLFLRIRFDGITKTNTITGNDQYQIVIPFYNSSSSRLKYSIFSHGYIKISNILLPKQDTQTVLLYTISQSAPRKLITPIGEKNIQPFGLDGPHNYSTIKNGLKYLKKYGYRGTIWFDREYMHNKNCIAFFKSLIHHEFWEAGIHFSKSLTKLSSSQVNKLISDEYTEVSSQLDTSLKTWCSLRNDDNVDFANYNFDNYKMIWRNGAAGINAEPVIGNLDDDTWVWWNLASKSGLIYPVFTHQTDLDPAVRYSISYSKFKTWVDNYQANGISIVPFSEWWLINANTNDTLITNLSVQNRTLKFGVKTNGERALVNVNISAGKDLKIIDCHTDEIINWTNHLDNSITFFVRSNHEYAICKT